MNPAWLPRLLRGWLLTAVSDGLFSSCLAAFAYGSTVTRLWQGVASVPLGASALEGGARTALVGIAIHAGVALTWSTVFLILYTWLQPIRSVTSTTAGIFAIAAAYGPIIWMTMSLLLIPRFTHRPPTINYRWWVQWFGHMIFVGLPIVWSIAGPRRPAP
jgi:hypothetical protein